MKMKMKKRNKYNLVLLAAINVLGSEARALSWIHSHQIALNCAPIEILDKKGGYKRIMDLLNAIEYGTYL